MRACVTGGTGFLGANLVAGLNERGIEARILRRESSSSAALVGLSYESVICDVLADPADLTRAFEGCDWLFHVAAVSDYWRQKKELIYQVNVEGTRRVLAAAREAGVKRVVFTSSLASMGIPVNGQLLDESATFNLKPDLFPYGHSKLLAEQEARKAAEGGLEVIIVNPSIVLGPRDINQISGSILLEAARGLARFNLPGGVNYVAVADVVDGHLAAAEKGRVGERYILGGVNINHTDMLRLVCEMVGKPAPRFTLPRWILPPAARIVDAARVLFGNRIPFEGNQVLLVGEFMYVDASKADRELGLKHTPLRETVQRAIDWYNENGFL